MEARLDLGLVCRPSDVAALYHLCHGREGVCRPPSARSTSRGADCGWDAAGARRHMHACAGSRCMVAGEQVLHWCRGGGHHVNV